MPTTPKGCYPGIYRIWVHADKVAPLFGGEPVGLFVIIRPEPISEKELEVAVSIPD